METWQDKIDLWLRLKPNCFPINLLPSSYIKKKGKEAGRLEKRLQLPFIKEFFKKTKTQCISERRSILNTRDKKEV